MRFPTVDEERTLPLTPQRDGSKSEFVVQLQKLQKVAQSVHCNLTQAEEELTVEASGLMQPTTSQQTYDQSSGESAALKPLIRSSLIVRSLTGRATRDSRRRSVPPTA